MVAKSKKSPKSKASKSKSKVVKSKAKVSKSKIKAKVSKSKSKAKVTKSKSKAKVTKKVTKSSGAAISVKCIGCKKTSSISVKDLKLKKAKKGPNRVEGKCPKCGRSISVFTSKENAEKFKSKK